MITRSHVCFLHRSMIDKGKKGADMFQKVCMFITMFSVFDIPTMLSAATYDEVTSNKRIIEKLPTQPKLVTEQYIPYLQLGTGKLIGYLPLSVNNIAQRCSEGDKVYLYPDTRFAEWMVLKWIKFSERSRIILPDAGTFVQAPHYLQDDGAGPKAFRIGHCDRNGTFNATDLPNGRYIAVVEIRIYVQGKGSITHIVPGEKLPVTQLIRPQAILADGFILVGGPYSIKDQTSLWEMDDKQWYVVGHQSFQQGSR